MLDGDFDKTSGALPAESMLNASINLLIVERFVSAPFFPRVMVERAMPAISHNAFIFIPSSLAWDSRDEIGFSI